jgi:hypothetical protein
METKKPYKTMEFWAQVALTNIGLLMTSGVVLDGKVAMGLGWAVTLLTSLGFKSLLPKKEESAEAPPAG